MRMTEAELKQLLKNRNLHVQESTSSTKPRKGKSKDEFQSLAEQRYFEYYVQPLEITGQLDHWSIHESFVVCEAFSYEGRRFTQKIYSPDFMLYFKDGSVKAVEVKDKHIRKLQREYPLKRQLFVQKYCVPNHWIFEEVDAAELTS